ncbi:MAG: transcription antitermination factor NusB [Bacillota bacterium]|nr:transcription antitermination factor NusB [Bacillota bacterium]
MKRSDARELVMQLLFQMEAQNDYTKASQEKFIVNFAGENIKDQYIDNCIETYIANRNDIDKLIEEASDKWHINRMAKVDLAILRLAVTEIKFLKDSDVPNQVSINEAVNMAKKFGSDNSQKFINGILGKIAK